MSGAVLPAQKLGLTEPKSDFSVSTFHRVAAMNYIPVREWQVSRGREKDEGGVRTEQEGSGCGRTEEDSTLETMASKRGKIFRTRKKPRATETPQKSMRVP